MSARCFVSYKTEDSLYKDIVLRMNIGAFIRPPNAGVECYSEDCTPEDARKEILRDSIVTIYLIGRYSAESLGREEQKYIKKELQVSLCRAEDGLPCSVLGVVLPEAENAVFQGTYKCAKCGKAHANVIIDDSTVVREFSQNYSTHNCNEGGYCVLTRWGDFIADPGKYIEEACLRRAGPAAQSITARPR